jgi:hypothetical protein
MNFQKVMKRIQKKRKRAKASGEQFTEKSEALRATIGILDEILDEQDGVSYDDNVCEGVA